jgi:phosphate-selective porin OprO/OprP
MEAYKVTDGDMRNSLAANGEGFGTRFQGSMNCSGGDGVQQATVNGCKSGAKSYTAGLKWILNPNVQFKLNYMHTKFDDAWVHYDVNGTVSGSNVASTAEIKKEDLVMFRTQYAF